MTTRTVEMSEATQTLAESAEQAEKGPIIVTRQGRPIAIMIAVENADVESLTLSQNPQFLALIEHSRERQKREGGLSSDEVRVRLGLSR
jgi:PHD/YefM family antitoxin component YafN of YafNO toxin-antitoxin module